jgi:TonB family protein
VAGVGTASREGNPVAVAEPAPSVVPGAMVAPPTAPQTAPPTALPPLPRAAAPAVPPSVAAVESASSPVQVPEVAAALPATPAPPPAPAANPQPVRLHARNRPLPALPRRALRAGFDHGQIDVRLHVNASGNVERVDLLRADPAQLYDATVRQVLEGWTFDPPGRAAEQDVQLDFKP